MGSQRAPKIHKIAQKTIKSAHRLGSHIHLGPTRAPRWPRGLIFDDLGLILEHFFVFFRSAKVCKSHVFLLNASRSYRLAKTRGIFTSRSGEILRLRSRSPARRLVCALLSRRFPVLASTGSGKRPLVGSAGGSRISPPGRGKRGRSPRKGRTGSFCALRGSGGPGRMAQILDNIGKYWKRFRPPKTGRKQHAKNTAPGSPKCSKSAPKVVRKR